MFFYKRFILLLIILMPLSINNLSGYYNITVNKQNDSLDKIITLPGGKKTIYSFLNIVSDTSGYMFIYDSRLITNDKLIKIKEGRYSIREAIYKIIQDSSLNIAIEKNHIIIKKKDIDSSTTKKNDIILKHKIIEGKLLDKNTELPIEFCSICIDNSSVSTITNLNGEFRLIIPDSLLSRTLIISHIGYRTKKIPISLLQQSHNIITISQEAYRLQEVYIKSSNPKDVIKQMIEKRRDNYIDKPVYFTTFYREGVEYKKTLINLTEGIFKIYKAPLNNHFSNDQVKLLRKSIIKNINVDDTLNIKILAGIDACLKLDIIKNLPDYLQIDNNTYNNLYKYKSGNSIYTDSTYIDVINFEPAYYNNSSIYKGTLYIEERTNALINATIKLSDNFINKETNIFVVQQGKKIKIIPIDIIYTISYKPWNGKYYINHIRGDLSFKIKKQRKLFGNYILHTWFEMVTCKITDNNVKRFSHNEQISTYSIFSEKKYSEDNKTFWDNFNIVPWEQELSKNIDKISKTIENISIEQ